MTTVRKEQDSPSLQDLYKREQIEREKARLRNFSSINPKRLDSITTKTPIAVPANPEYKTWNRNFTFTDPTAVKSHSGPSNSLSPTATKSDWKYKQNESATVTKSASDTLSPKSASDTLSPKSASDTLSPKSVSDTLSPKFTETKKPEVAVVSAPKPEQKIESAPKIEKQPVVTTKPPTIVSNPVEMQVEDSEQSVQEKEEARLLRHISNATKRTTAAAFPKNK